MKIAKEQIAKLALEAKCDDFGAGSVSRKLTYPSARPRKSLSFRLRQSPGVETIDKGGSIKLNTTPLVDGSTAGAFTQPERQRLSWSGTSGYRRFARNPNPAPKAQIWPQMEFCNLLFSLLPLSICLLFPLCAEPINENTDSIYKDQEQGTHSTYDRNLRRQTHPASQPEIKAERSAGNRAKSLHRPVNKSNEFQLRADGRPASDEYELSCASPFEKRFKSLGSRRGYPLAST